MAQFKFHKKIINENLGSWRDKTGPWNFESDNYSFEYKGIKCSIERSESTGHLCGHINIGSNIHKTIYDWLSNYSEEVLQHWFRVHGGITHREESSGILTIGFDCAHSFDYIPINGEIGEVSIKNYRTMEYVKKELQDLIDQIYNHCNTKPPKKKTRLRFIELK